MKHRFQQKKEQMQRMARDRIIALFVRAESVFKESPQLAHRYVHLAFKLSTKYKARIPSELKRRFCKNCLSYLVPSVNCRVRTSKGRLVILCLECQHYTRVPYKAKIRRARI